MKSYVFMAKFDTHRDPSVHPISNEFVGLDLLGVAAAQPTVDWAAVYEFGPDGSDTARTVDYYVKPAPGSILRRAA